MRTIQIVLPVALLALPRVAMQKRLEGTGLVAREHLHLAGLAKRGEHRVAGAASNTRGNGQVDRPFWLPQSRVQGRLSGNGARSRLQRHWNQGVRRRRRSLTTDCPGSHEVMARQVRLWLTQPALDEAPRVRVSDRGVDQRNPSGTASASRGTSPDVRVQSNLRAVATGKPGRPRASMYVIREYAAHHSTDPRPFIRTRSARGSRQKVIRANRRPGAQRT